MLLSLGRFALRLLIFLHRFPLPLGVLVYCFSLLLRGFAGLLAIFSDAAVFALGLRRYSLGATESEQEYKSQNSFHNDSKWICSDLNTEANARQDLGDQELVDFRNTAQRN